MRNYFCQYRYRNLNACKFHLERHLEYSTGPTADKTNVTLVRSNDFSRAGNTFPWTSASLKITLMESTYPGQRPQSPSLSPHFLLIANICYDCYDSFKVTSRSSKYVTGFLTATCSFWSASYLFFFFFLTSRVNSFADRPILP